MTLENLCCSLEQAKKLKELGVPQDSLFYWTDEDFILMGCKEKWKITNTKGLYKTAKYISAFTSGELGEMLSKYGNFITWKTNKNKWAITLMSTQDYPELDSDTEADARAKCLIMLLENKLITL